MITAQLSREPLVLIQYQRIAVLQSILYIVSPKPEDESSRLLPDGAFAETLGSQFIRTPFEG